jgi:hypothetical protein
LRFRGRAFIMAIIDDYRRPLAGEAAGDLLADSPRPAGNQNNLFFEGHLSSTRKSSAVPARPFQTENDFPFLIISSAAKTLACRSTH